MLFQQMIDEFFVFQATGSHCGNLKFKFTWLRQVTYIATYCEVPYDCH